jgi:ABC-2 type transport system ATP-binding protein
MIEIRDITKVYGRTTTAVDHLTFTVKPGIVTGFLGPNGAGKSTTMRMILGLDRPTSGEILVAGRRYDEHHAPLHEVGALLDARGFHPGRSAYHHLLTVAMTGGYGRRRVREVLEMVGLDSVAGKRTRGFSLGMGQRLGIAAALIGDPAVVMLDEPVNGLDPDGIRWIRGLLRGLAGEGRTVFVSSHLMSEVALTADHLVVIGRGRLIADMPLAQMTSATTQLRVRTTEPARLRELLAGAWTVSDGPDGPDGTDGTLLVSGGSAEDVARTALANNILILELTPVHPTLEDAYYALTRGDVEYTMVPGRAAA